MKKTRMVAMFIAIAISLTVWSGLTLANPVLTESSSDPPGVMVVADVSSSVDSAALSADISPAPSVPTSTVSDTVSTVEEGIDPEVEDIDPAEVIGLIQSLIGLLQGKNWLGASIVIIMLLTSFLKTPMVNEFAGRVIPKRFIILIPLGLGVVAGGLQAVIEGGWQNAIATVLSSGTMAVFLHEFVDRVVKGNKNE